MSKKRLSQAFIYSRVSSTDQVENGQGLRDQQVRGVNYFVGSLMCKGVELKENVKDEGVSAYKVDFFDRPGGKYLASQLDRGDHLIVDKIDRLWRSLADFVRVTQYLEKRGIILHIVSLDGQTISSDNAIGRTCLQMLVIAAELELSLIHI